MSDSNKASRPEFTITRILDAPRETVWRAWTDPAELSRWHHPRNMRTPVETVSADVRVGGSYQYTMVDDASGESYPTVGVYLEVVEGERLQYTWAEPGDSVEDSPIVTITLAERDGKTELTFHLIGIDGKPGDDDVYDGWSEALDNLAGYLVNP